jgi:hypothetical protein
MPGQDGRPAASNVDAMRVGLIGAGNMARALARGSDDSAHVSGRRAASQDATGAVGSWSTP